jgi:hypothetical protein
MFMTFSIYKIFTNINTITTCTNSKIFNVHTCKRIKEVSRLRYLRIISDNNLRWHLHSHNIAGMLRAITNKFNKLNNLIQKKNYTYDIFEPVKINNSFCFYYLSICCILYINIFNVHIFIYFY